MVILFFMEVNVKAARSVCSQHVAVLKEYKLHGRDVCLHVEEYDNFQGQRRKEKVDEVLSCLKKQQSVFTYNQEVSDAAVKAS